MGFFAGAFCKNFHRLPKESAVVFLGDLIDDFKQLIITLLFDLCRDGILQMLLSPRAWPGGIFEDKTILVPDLLNQFNGCLEIFLRFSRKAHDEISCQGEVRDNGLCFFNESQILLRCISPVHCLQNPVGAALGRNMQVGTDLRQAGHRLKNRILHFGRVAGNEANPAEFIDLADHFKQVGQSISAAAFAVPIGIDGLAEQRNLPDALRGEFLGLLKNGLGRTRDFRPSNIGNDAETAEVVAAPHHPDEGLRFQMIAV